MTNSVALKLAFVVLACMVVGAPLASQAFTCSQVSASMRPCINYLKNGGTVPPPCCNGVQYLSNSARTTIDRQSICRCLVAAARSTRGLNPNLAAGLPNRCGVRLPYTISPSTNCNAYVINKNLFLLSLSVPAKLISDTYFLFASYSILANSK